MSGRQDTQTYINRGVIVYRILLNSSILPVVLLDGLLSAHCLRALYDKAWVGILPEQSRILHCLLQRLLAWAIEVARVQLRVQLRIFVCVRVYVVV